jgi:thiol:disulfide interchange protein DsbC
MKQIADKRKDIIFYVKLFPLSMHKDAYWKSKSILCNNSMKLLEDCYEGRKIEKTECENSEVDETIKLAGSLGITGTPAIILPDGRLRTGALPESELIDLIDGKK